MPKPAESPEPQGSEGEQDRTQPQEPGERAPHGGPYEWWQRGTELLERGDAAAAAVLLERTVQADDRPASGWEALGRASYDARDFPRAVEAFEELLRRSPDSHYGHFALGLSLTRLDRFELAVEHLAVAATMRPERHDYTDRLRQARATLRARREKVDGTGA